MAGAVCGLIHGRIESRPETWANASRNTLDHCLFDFELISHQCVSIGSDQLELHRETLSDILLFHATHSRHHVILIQQGIAHVSFGVVRDTSLEP